MFFLLPLEYFGKLFFGGRFVLYEISLRLKSGEHFVLRIIGERKRMVDDILKRMNISHRAKHFPQQLSGGQQQRVAIARAVVTNPKLILADEPTGNLDSKNGAEVMNLLTELNREGTTIVMVTHSRHDASFAHRTVHLFDGSVVASVASNDL